MLATTELRKRLQTQASHQGITAKRLAEFLADVQGHEAVLMHRQRDAEAQDVFAQMGASRKESSRSVDTQPPTVPPSTVEEGAREQTDVYAGLEIYEEYR